MKNKKEIMLETIKVVEMYKAGFIDGYIVGKGKETPWKKIYKKCTKSFNKRFLKNEN